MLYMMYSMTMRLAAAAILMMSTCALAQTAATSYPARPIRFVVGFAAGGQHPDDFTEGRGAARLRLKSQHSSPRTTRRLPAAQRHSSAINLRAVSG